MYKSHNTQGGKMRKLLFLLVIFSFVYMANAQYSSNVSGYYIHFDKLDAGQTMPTPDVVITENTTMTAEWQRGTSNVGYETPYLTTSFHVAYIANTTNLWDNGTAATPITVSFSDGIYEITVVEEDENGNQSGRSQPFFIEFKSNYARVPFNFQFR